MDQKEKKIIDELNGIEELSMKVIQGASGLPFNKAYPMLGQLQELYIQYGEMLEEHISWIRTVLLNESLAKHARIALEDNVIKLGSAVGICEDICEALYRLAEDGQADFDANAEKFRFLEGKLALFMRYEILTDHDEEANDRGIDRAADILQKTARATGDNYCIRIMVNHVCRHYFPQFKISDVAIVMQGQIKYEDDFTLETLYRYRRIYPDTPLIVSTWRGEVKDLFRWRAEAIGVDILENEYPRESSRYHLNYQLHSSREGIKHAQVKYRVRYGLKCRTDQRFYMLDFLQYFNNEIRLFPIKNVSKTEERIIFNGVNSSMLSYPFRISDFWAYGTVNDLIKLYSAPYPEDKGGDAHKKMWDDMPLENANVIDEMTKRERLSRAYEHENLFDSESYIIRSYYENHILGRKLLPDEDDLFIHYWDFLKNYTIIEDPEILHMYWPKYNSAKYVFDSSTYEGALTHSTWLNLVMRGQ